MEGKKFDKGKIRMDLLPFRSLVKVAEVLTFGAEKYEPDGWKRVPDAYERYTAAQLRHHAAMRMGEECDEDSELLHLAHEACNVLFRLELYLDSIEDIPDALPD